MVVAITGEGKLSGDAVVAIGRLFQCDLFVNAWNETPAMGLGYSDGGHGLTNNVSPLEIHEGWIRD